MKLKKIIKKFGLAMATVVVVVAGAAGFSAFEAHVINVTARIENALTVPLERAGLNFGTVFPQEALDQNFDVTLSESFQDQADGDTGSNLLVNGSFETPIVTTGWEAYASGTPGLGWTVEWVPGQATTQGSATRPDPAKLELQRNPNSGWVAADGDQYAELDSDWDGFTGTVSGEQAHVSIYQNISTVAGQSYKLSYAFSPRPTTADNKMNVEINDAVVQSVSEDGTISPGNTVWTPHTVNFTASSGTTKIEFVADGIPDSFGIFLDDVELVGTGRLSTVDYMIRQKPKCGIPSDVVGPEGSVTYSGFAQVGEDAEGNFVCPTVTVETEGGPTQVESVALPLLCPYLSKHETTADGEGENDSVGINSFHGLPGTWTMTTTEATEVTGQLSALVADLSDTWNIDLKVPAFEGAAAQDWADFVHTFNPDADPDAYLADPNLEHEIFGCDLWLEVTNLQ